MMCGKELRQQSEPHWTVASFTGGGKREPYALDSILKLHRHFKHEIEYLDALLTIINGISQTVFYSEFFFVTVQISLLSNKVLFNIYIITVKILLQSTFNEYS